jgi:hypothetical protein
VTFTYKLTMKKLEKNRGGCDRLHLLAAILVRWWRLVASNKALSLLYLAMHAVLYRRTAMAITKAIKVGPFFHCCFVCCCPGSRWGNIEQVVAQWWHPVASGVALDMLHWVMLSVSLGAPPWPSKRPENEAHLLISAYFFLNTICS